MSLLVLAANRQRSAPPPPPPPIFSEGEGRALLGAAWPNLVPAFTASFDTTDSAVTFPQIAPMA